MITEAETDSVDAATVGHPATTLLSMTKNRRELTLMSLAGLSVGDAFGERFFWVSHERIAAQQLPAGPWPWTDDTHMALSIVDVLFAQGRIDQDELARLFAERFREQPWRGYGAGAYRLLTRYTRGADWREEAPKLFDGGSYGNGGAMRAAPIGAFFAGDPHRAAVEARRAAAVTHAHLEGQAGAMAVAAATAYLSSAQPPSGVAFLQQITTHVPVSMTRDRIEAATHIEAEALDQAIVQLGTGQQVAAFDTAPFCLWVVAHHALDYETALWTTVSGLGDRDTTCAIVGGMIGASRPLPSEWLRRREPLPEEYAVE